MKKLLLIAISLICISVVVKAEKPKFKFGKVTIEEVQKNVYDIDTTASAIVLCDIGENRMAYVNGSGWRILKDFHVRIKILKEGGLNFASKVIYYNDNAEYISGVKAFTYNIENGKLVKYKLSKEGVFKEKINDNGSRKISITLPKVKVGSVIEYTYSVSSKNTNDIDAWSFQGAVPVLFSSFKVEIPEYWTFKKLTSGYIYVKTTSEDVARTDYSATITTYTAENVITFPKDSYIDSKENYISRVKHELSKITVPGSVYKDFNSDWKTIRENLSKSENFGERIDKTNFIVEELPDSIVKAKNDINKLKFLYEYVNSNLKWDDYNSMYCGESIKTVWKDKKGSAGRINFTLISLLNTLGFEVYPVILKTRAMGLPHPAQIIINEYNYVIALVKLDGKDILLDATDPLLKMGFIPERCINGKGQLISKDYGQEVDLEQNNTDSFAASGLFSFDDDLRLKAQVSFNYDDIAAFDVRSTYEDMDDDNFHEKFSEKIKDFDVNSIEAENRKYIYEPMKIKLDLSSIEAPSNKEKLFIDPLFFVQHKENPFKLNERVFPVNYPNLISKRIYYKYQIPAGYEVEELPKPILISIPEKGLVYKYQILNMNGELIVNVSFKTNKRKFSVEEYPALKEAYRVIVEKEAEKIVLKKSGQA